MLKFKIPAGAPQRLFEAATLAVGSAPFSPTCRNFTEALSEAIAASGLNFRDFAAEADMGYWRLWELRAGLEAPILGECFDLAAAAAWRSLPLTEFAESHVRKPKNARQNKPSSPTIRLEGNLSSGPENMADR